MLGIEHTLPSRNRRVSRFRGSIYQHIAWYLRSCYVLPPGRHVSSLRPTMRFILRRLVVRNIIPLENEAGDPLIIVAAQRGECDIVQFLLGYECENFASYD